MIIRRNKIFSNKESENDSLAKGLGIMGGGIIGIKKAGKKGAPLFEDKNLSKENSKVFNKLQRHARKQGTEVYTGSRDTMRDGGFYNKGRLKGPYRYLDKEGCRPGKAGDLIVTSENADVLAHELGHSKYQMKGRIKGGTVGKVAHKTDRLGRAYLGVPGLATSFMTGMSVGTIEEDRKLRGKKESKLLRHSSWAIPVAAATPVLTAEALASKKGLKLLKESGASKELLKKSKKNLGKAWGTYAASTVASAGSAEAGRVVGKRVARKSAKNKDTKK